MSERDARRARWRADLHEYGAAALRSAGLDAMADASDAEIAWGRAYADLLQELGEAKAARAADPGSSAALLVLQDVKARIVAFRQALRVSDVPRPGIVNNISEPSDAELIELGY